MGEKKARGRPTIDEQGRPKKSCTFRLSPEIVEFIAATWKRGDRTASIEDAIRRCEDFKQWMEARR